METAATNDGSLAAALTDDDGADRDDEVRRQQRRPSFFAPSAEPLPERVCQLFLMRDFNNADGESTASAPFFRSPYLWERLPQMLFSNGADGLGADGLIGAASNSRSVRNIPIKLLAEESQQQQQSASGSFQQQQGMGMMTASNVHQQQQVDTDSRQPRPSEFPSPSSREEDDRFWRHQQISSPELRRHFASLFWTPQQARRIAEREQQRGGRGGENGGFDTDPEEVGGGTGRRMGGGGGLGGSSVTIYSIPISNNSATDQTRRSAERRPTEAGKREQYDQQSSGEENGSPYSAIPFRRRPGLLNSALSTPSLFHGKTLSPTREKPPLPPSSSISNTPARAKPPTSFPAAISQPQLRRTQTAFSVPQQELPRRDSEPNIVGGGLISEEDQRRLGGIAFEANNNNNGHQQRRQAQQQQQHWASSRVAAPAASDSSTLSEDGSSMSGSMSSSSESRSKSPSLASLRQSLLRLSGKKGASASSLLMPSCVRARQSSGSDQEEQANNNNSGSNALINKRTGGIGSQNSLTASSLRLTQFAPSSQQQQKEGANSRGFVVVDAVEEAIRSLEQFNPSEFVHRQYRQPMANGRPGVVGPPPKVFLARAEPVSMPKPLSASSSMVSSSSSASSLASSADRRSSLLSFASSADDPPAPVGQQFQQQQHRRPSTLSSGSATPTQQTALPELQLHPFSQSADSLRTPRANSPAASGTRQTGLPAEMDLLISRLRGQQRRGVTFNDQPPTQHFYAPFDGPPPDYSEEESGSSGDEADDGEKDDQRNAAALEAEAQLRKRFLCSQLTDCAKVVEISALKMGQFVAAGSGLGGWRQPHILRHNLGAIRDTIYTVEFALDELVESLGRVSLDPRDPRRVHLRQLAHPVQTSLAMLRRLRASLDSTGWALPAVARHRDAGGRGGGGQDALDQVVAILPQLPKDCSKLVQWIYSLSVWPDPRADRPTAVFLPASATPAFRPTLQPPPPPAPQPTTIHQQNGFGQVRAPSPTSSLQNYYSSSEEEPKEKTNGKGPEVMDGGESTSSTSSSAAGAQQTGEQEGTNNGRQQPQKTMTATALHPTTKEMPAAPPDELVLEEDDLASVVSECPADGHWTELHSPPGVSPLHRRVNAELARSLAPEQREMFRLYEPQMAAHIAAICTLIEEFFSLVEAHKEPKLSFQKIQMVYIEGHSLVGIARVLCRDDAIAQHRPLSAFLAHESAKLDGLLNECLTAAKMAKTRAQSISSIEQTRAHHQQTVPAVQSMCQAVVAVSDCANQLRAFWRNCSGH